MHPQERIEVTVSKSVRTLYLIYIVIGIVCVCLFPHAHDT